MDCPKDEIEAANERAAERLAKTPTAVAARYDRRIGRLVIDLSTGLSIAFKPHDAQGLEAAKPQQLSKIEISPSGFGIYFPDLDADLYLPGLLEGFLARGGGWLRSWARQGEDQPRRLKPLLHGGTANGEDDRKRNLMSRTRPKDQIWTKYIFLSGAGPLGPQKENWTKSRILSSFYRVSGNTVIDAEKCSHFRYRPVACPRAGAAAHSLRVL